MAGKTGKNGIPKGKAPKGLAMATVKVGEKGQIVIPKNMRDMFGIQPGDTLLAMADIDRGIALARNDVLQTFAENVLNTQASQEVADDDGD